MVAQCLAALLYLGVATGELAYDPFVREAIWKLLQDAHYGFVDTEEAMFVIRGPDGRLSFTRWRTSGIVRHAQWDGPVPFGVVAIVHTHPNWSPRPSMNDIRTAMRINLPVYVVTRTHITKTARGETSVVAKEWRAGL